MSVAKRLTSKPTSHFDPSTRPQSADLTPDSGVQSLESGDSSDARESDSFQEALMNLKALNGEVAEEGSLLSSTADLKGANKMSNGVITIKATMDKSSAAKASSSVLERLSGTAAAQDGKKSPPTSQKGEMKVSSSPSHSDQDGAKKASDVREKGPSPEPSDTHRNSVNELITHLSKDSKDRDCLFGNMLGHSSSGGQSAPLARTEKDKVPKSQKGNLFENFTSDAIGCDSGRSSPPPKVRLDSSEKTAVTSTAGRAPCSKKDGGASEAANKHTIVTALRPFSKITTKADPGTPFTGKDVVEESTSLPVSQSSDKQKNGPKQMDRKSKKNDEDISMDESEKSHENPSDDDENADQKDVQDKSPEGFSSGKKSDSGTEEKTSSEKDNALVKDKPSDLTSKCEKDSSDEKSTKDLRKRSAEETLSGEDLTTAPKRSRLVDVIGKLASNIGVPPDKIGDPEPMQEEDSELEDSMDSDSAEAKSEESGLLEDEDDGGPPSSSESRIAISAEEIEELWRQKMEEYLLKQQQRDEEVEELRAKLEEALNNSEHYRKEWKEMQRQVLELTIMKNRLERRKAATNALRSIATKNVAVQVDTSPLTGGAPSKAGKLTLVMPGAGGVTSSVVGSSGVSVVPISPLQANTVQRPSTIITSTPIQRPVGQQVRSVVPTSVVAQPVLRHLLPTANPLHAGSTTVKSLLDAKNSAAASADRRVINSTGASAVIAPKTVGTATKIATSAPPAAKQGVIDLTDDDDGGRTQQAQPAASAARTVQLATASNVRPSLVPAGSVYRPVTTVQPGSTPILVSTNPPVASTNMTRSGILQVVALTNSNSTIRPGSLLTVMSQPSVKTSVATPIRPSVRPSTTQAPPAIAPVTSRPPPASVATVPALASRPHPSHNPAPAKVNPTAHAAKTVCVGNHPAPLPATPPCDPTVGGRSAPPPQPSLKISRVTQGIVLSWNMVIKEDNAQIKSYQLYAYQETSSPPNTSLWKKVGDVNALPLPMACTLTQFQEGNKYHFAVRAQDVYDRIGSFSEPSAIHLTHK